MHSESSPRGEAVITLLSHYRNSGKGDPAYMSSLTGLVKTFRDWNPWYRGDFICIHTGFETGALSKLDDLNVTFLELPHFSKRHRLAKTWTKGSRYSPTWDKLWIFNMTQFSRILFIDADVAVVSDLAEWFQLPVEDGQMWARPEFTGKSFNSGVMVFKPTAGRFETMLELLATGCKPHEYHAFGEQEFLNCYFRSFGKLQGHCLIHDFVGVDCKVKHFNGQPGVKHATFLKPGWYCRFMRTSCDLGAQR